MCAVCCTTAAKRHCAGPRGKEEEVLLAEWPLDSFFFFFLYFFFLSLFFFLPERVATYAPARTASRLHRPSTTEQHALVQGAVRSGIVLISQPSAAMGRRKPDAAMCPESGHELSSETSARVNFWPSERTPGQAGRVASTLWSVVTQPTAAAPAGYGAGGVTAECMSVPPLFDCWFQ